MRRTYRNYDQSSPVPGVGSLLRLARAVGYPLGVRLSALRRPF